jgi:hypothetical protein
MINEGTARKAANLCRAEYEDYLNSLLERMKESKVSINEKQYKNIYMAIKCDIRKLNMFEGELYNEVCSYKECDEIKLDDIERYVARALSLYIKPKTAYCIDSCSGIYKIVDEGCIELI